MQHSAFEIHHNAAIVLYQQRANWLQQAGVAMQAMIELEKRLRIHLYVLSYRIDEDEPEPGNAVDT